jgi:hypothetical protein
MLRRTAVRYKLRLSGGGKPARANFEVAGFITETFCLGNIALREGKKITWDAVAMTTNTAEANALIKPSYREGCEI